MAQQEDVFKKIVSHCKEYGFVFPSSEIYDGLGAVYDYSLNTFIIVSVGAQLIAVPCYLLSERSFADENGR